MLQRFFIYAPEDIRCWVFARLIGKSCSDRKKGRSVLACATLSSTETAFARRFLLLMKK